MALAWVQALASMALDQALAQALAQEQEWDLAWAQALVTTLAAAQAQEWALAWAEMVLTQAQVHMEHVLLVYGVVMCSHASKPIQAW